jgi:hypothetical protein
MPAVRDPRTSTGAVPVVREAGPAHTGPVPPVPPVRPAARPGPVPVARQRPVRAVRPDAEAPPAPLPPPSDLQDTGRHHLPPLRGIAGGRS